MVDVAPADKAIDPVDEVRKIEAELSKYSEKLANQPRWLVLNKVDLLPEEEQKATCENIIEELNWKAPVFTISALKKLGTQELAKKIMQYLDESAEEYAQANNDKEQG